MPKYAALLRAVNVGGTGKLPMAKLRDICAEIGFSGARTLLASGNVVFETDIPASKAHAALDDKLSEFFGQSIGLFILTGEQMRSVRKANPFADHPPNQVGVLFVDEMPSDEAISNAKGQKNEEIIAREGVLFIKFPNGMGQSKLIVPGADRGTMRNMNTVQKIDDLLNE